MAWCVPIKIKIGRVNLYFQSFTRIGTGVVAEKCNREGFAD